MQAAPPPAPTPNPTPSAHALILQFARRFLALAGRGRACSARPDPSRRAGDCARAPGEDEEGRSPKEARPRVCQVRPGLAALRGLPRDRWRDGAQRPPTPRPAPVNQPPVREGVGGPTPAPQAAATSRGGSVSRKGSPGGQGRTCSGPRRVEHLGWGRGGLLGIGEFLREGLVAKVAFTSVSSHLP